LNQDQTKELLRKLRPEVPEFTVIFTGKSSRKVNGLYKPESREILLHNKNFNSDTELLYTAIHELAHHLHYLSDAPPVGSRCHTKTFWLIFHGLLTEAIEKGVYCPPVEPELAKAAGEVRSCMRAEGEALKATGQALTALVAMCGKHHVRFEDYLDRVLGMSRVTARTAMAAFAQDVPAEAGPDQVKLLVSVRDPETRRELQATPGSLVEKQAAAAGRVVPRPMLPAPEPLGSVEREKARLEARLARMEEECEAIRTKIQNLEESQVTNAARPADRQYRLEF